MVWFLGVDHLILDVKLLKTKGAGTWYSILEINFLHYVANFFCETIKLPKEVPKITLGIFRLVRVRV
jgi:hypothetical protein